MDQNIFNFGTDSDKFGWLRMTSPNWNSYYKMLNGENTKPVMDSWIPPQFELHDKKKLYDFPSLGLYIGISYKAWQALEPLLGNSVEALPIGAFYGQDYFLMHILEEIAAVDYSKSSIETTDGIKRITHCVFVPEMIKGKHIFRIPENRTRMLVSEEFKNCVEDSKLIGARFGALKTIPCT